MQVNYRGARPTLQAVALFLLLALVGLITAACDRSFEVTYNGQTYDVLESWGDTTLAAAVVAQAQPGYDYSVVITCWGKQPKIWYYTDDRVAAGKIAHGAWSDHAGDPVTFCNRINEE